MLAGLLLSAGLLCAEETNPLPDLAALEAAGAVIGEIRISPLNIFDTQDTQEDNAIFRAVNFLHIRTRPEVIRRNLLFKTGDRLSIRLIEETERLVRTNRYIYDFRVLPVAVKDGVVDLEVVTRDTWTLNPGISFSRAGGTNSSGLSLVELNLMGTGTRLSVSQSSTVDRSGREVYIGQDHLLDGWTSLNASHANNSDGQRDVVAIDRPFYASDTRWAAGLRATDDDRLDPVYAGGKIVSQFRHHLREIETYGGHSRGLDQGWVHRWSGGLLWRQEDYSFEPDLAAPTALPANEKVIAPFLRHELIEEDVTKVRNRNQIGRPEYFSMGFTAKTSVYRASTRWNAGRNLWLYETRIANGFIPRPGDSLLASMEIKGTLTDQRAEKLSTATSLTYYHPHRDSALFFASLTADTLIRAPMTEQLLLGGDNGLRGYPTRYQSGTQRVLMTVENRFYTDWFPFRLIRVGGALFADLGRAWGGPLPDPNSDRWLGDLGIGLRFASVRAAFGNVLHVDLAFPVEPASDIKKVQLLVKTKLSY